MRRLVVGLILSLLLGTVNSAAPNSQRKVATLIEVHASPRCYGLDCPPWPMPWDDNVCLQIDQSYYTGTYSPWGVPWVTSGKRLLELKGQSIEVVITDMD